MFYTFAGKCTKLVFFHSNYNDDIKSDTLDSSNADDDIRLMRMKLLESQQLSTAPPEQLLSVGNDGEEDLATLVIIIRLADTNTGCNDVTRRCSDSALIQIITDQVSCIRNISST